MRALRRGKPSLLAIHLRAGLLLIDELAGRVEAKRRGLRVTGTLGVLRAGAELGLIDVSAMPDRLRATTFYVDESLVHTIFKKWLPGGFG
jgi:predicted nucleic acid-binding protein